MEIVDWYGSVVVELTTPDVSVASPVPEPMVAAAIDAPVPPIVVVPSVVPDLPTRSQLLDVLHASSYAEMKIDDGEAVIVQFPVFVAAPEFRKERFGNDPLI